MGTRVWAETGRGVWGGAVAGDRMDGDQGKWEGRKGWEVLIALPTF